MWGMPPGFAELIRRKYDIMQQGADTQRIGVEANANLDRVRAGLMPAESKANIALTGAQTEQAKANAANTAESTKYIGPLAQSSIGLNSANAYNARQQGGLYSSEAETKNQLNRFLNFGMFRLSGN